MMDSSRLNVMCVDDELGVLNALQRNLRREAFNIVTTDSPNHALELLSVNEFAAVISDYRMPEMLGTEFLSLVRERHPEIRRVLLTGQADLKGVMTAVNEGGVHKFFLKPWDSIGLSTAIRECVEIYSLDQKNKILTEQLAVANKALNSLNYDLTAHLCDTVNRLNASEFYDADTGLANKKLLIKSVDRSIATAGTVGHRLTFIVIGIVDYALLNEALEKDQCNSIIVGVIEHLKRNLRSQDLLARIRDDTFCIATRTGGSVKEIAEFVNRLLVCVLTPRSDTASNTYLNACAGISIYGDHGETSEILLENAQTAMNRARNTAHSSIVFYDGKLHTNASSKVSLNNDLYQAVQNEEFFLNFQPRVDASSGIMVAAEVLLRWTHPVRGVVSPADFIPVLEESGLIEPVGEWIIRQTCKLANRLYAQGRPLLLAVNVSPYQFRADSFYQFVADTVTEADMPAEQFLELEITENVLITEVDKALESIRKLKNLGIKLAIDDFGTGYSSLSYLAEIPADYLKIDRAFVATILSKTNSRAIVASIISIAKSLQLSVIAEGVETEAQATILQQMGCDELQGFLYSRPVDEQSLIALLEGNMSPYGQ